VRAPRQHSRKDPTPSLMVRISAPSHWYDQGDSSVKTKRQQSLDIAGVSLVTWLRGHATISNRRSRQRPDQDRNLCTAATAHICHDHACEVVISRAEWDQPELIVQVSEMLTTKCRFGPNSAEDPDGRAWSALPSIRDNAAAIAVAPPTMKIP
jgi:hypothetical protein